MLLFVIAHYQRRTIEYIIPDFVHSHFMKEEVVSPGGKELAD